MKNLRKVDQKEQVNVEEGKVAGDLQTGVIKEEKYDSPNTKCCSVIIRNSVVSAKPSIQSIHKSWL